MVTIDISDKYVRKDIQNKRGGTFHEITVPRGTMVDEKDLSFYKFLVSELEAHGEKGYSTATFAPECSVTLKKAVKNLKTGDYDVLSEYVKAEVLSEAIHESYIEYKRSKEEVVER